MVISYLSIFYKYYILLLEKLFIDICWNPLDIFSSELV